MNKQLSILNYIRTAGSLLILCLSLACKKLIEIPGSPPSQLSTVQQFADSATTMTAVAAVYSYSAMSGMGFAYDDALLVESTGLSSDELLYSGRSDLARAAFFSYGLNATNMYLDNLWRTPYQGIYVINSVLDGVAASSGLSASFKNQITGEMKIIRALYNFNLVNLWGGVPVVTSTDYQVNASLPRSSVDSVYSRILADLLDAAQRLGPADPSNGRYRADRYTAQALLARVYLYRGQWQAAYDAASTVIGSNLFSLPTDLTTVFLDGSSEAIWQIPATGSSQVTREAMDFIPQTAGTVPNYTLTSFLLNAFEPGDQRLASWTGQVVINNGSGNQTLYYPLKYKNRYAPYTTTEDYMVLRLADLYLIRAEAAANLGNNTAALADLDLVRVRAGLSGSTADPASQSAVLNAIWHERQVELFTEWGNRWFDLKRTGRAGDILGTEKTGWVDKAQLYPIPQKQLQANPNLRQNTGY